MAEFYGFSPDNHKGETPTVTAPKYAVYDYLQGIDPVSAWAKTAADHFNKQFNTQQFNAIDDETLGYGDEYVHSGRPGGPGQTGSLSNPGGPGAFTWGTMTPENVTQSAKTSGIDPKAMQLLLKALAAGPIGPSQPGQPNPFDAILQQTQGQGANPFMQWMQNERQNQTAAQTPTSPTSQPSQTSQPDINQIVQQALMRAFMG